MCSCLCVCERDRARDGGWEKEKSNNFELCMHTCLFLFVSEIVNEGKCAATINEDVCMSVCVSVCVSGLSVCKFVTSSHILCIQQSVVGKCFH